MWQQILLPVLLAVSLVISGLFYQYGNLNSVKTFISNYRQNINQKDASRYFEPKITKKPELLDENTKVQFETEFATKKNSRYTRDLQSEHHSCYYEKNCQYDQQIDQQLVADNTELKQYLIKNLKKKESYHFTFDTASEQIFRDDSDKHSFKCDKNYYSDKVRIFCQYHDEEQSSLMISFGLSISVLLMLII